MNSKLKFLIGCGLILSWAICSPSFAAGQAKKPAKAGKASKKPLAKFKAEDLAKIDFCFNAFCKAVTDGDAKVVKAFLAEVPKNLAGLDLDKKADRKTLIQAYATFKNAQITSSRRFAGGVAQVGYANESGAQKTIRIQNIAGIWKIAGE